MKLFISGIVEYRELTIVNIILKFVSFVYPPFLIVTSKMVFP